MKLYWENCKIRISTKEAISKLAHFDDDFEINSKDKAYLVPASAKLRKYSEQFSLAPGLCGAAL